MVYVETAKNLSKDDIPKVGGKGANLSEMFNAGFPVPEAFFITVDAYKKFIELNNLRPRMNDIISEVNFSDVSSIQNASRKIHDIFMEAKFPESIKEEISKYYKMLGGMNEEMLNIEFLHAGKDPIYVAVRSSSTMEDIAKTSSAGQQETYLNIRGLEKLLTSIKGCWASLHTARAMYYRHKNNQPQDVDIGVIVQKMVNSYSSGITFTVDPTKPESNQMITEAVWGLGETAVQGQDDPDRYVIDKSNGQIADKKIGHKKIMRIRDPYENKTVIKDVPDDKSDLQILTDQQIIALAAYAKKIEDHYGKPQDIEWATERGKIYITQTRAITTLETKEVQEVYASEEPIVKGTGASPGLAKGTVKIITDMSQLSKIDHGDILVTEMTDPDFVPAMEKSSGIVTDKGGATCHAAIVSRELGIPCIVNTRTATSVLKDGDLVTVDAFHGLVYRGDVTVSQPETVEETSCDESFVQIGVTATVIKANVAFPQTAEKAAQKAEGVGLLRIEHMLTKSGKHPAQFIRDNNSEELTRLLVDGIGAVASAFRGKPVWVRTLDARTDEYRNMSGGENEPTEANPMLGWHGIRRDMDEPELLRAQFRAIKQLHERGLTNVAVMLPFVTNIEEIRRAKMLGHELGLPSTVEYGCMIETPASALIIEDICKEVSFISFGTNDLTMLVLGVDRGNENLVKLYNTFHPAVLRLMKHCIAVAKKNNVKTSICGEAGSDVKMAEILVGYGIDSMSANIDAVDKIRSTVARIEKRMLLDKMRE